MGKGNGTRRARCWSDWDRAYDVFESECAAEDISFGLDDLSEGELCVPLFFPRLLIVMNFLFSLSLFLDSLIF
jgi:hypothetical protein